MDKPIPVYQFNLPEDAEALTREKYVLEQERRDMAELLSSKAGMRFFRRLLLETGVFFVDNSQNSSVYTNNGKRAIGLWTLNKMTAGNPELRLADLLEVDEVMPTAKEPKP